MKPISIGSRARSIGIPSSATTTSFAASSSFSFRLDQDGSLVTIPRLPSVTGSNSCHAADRASGEGQRTGLCPDRKSQRSRSGRHWPPLDAQSCLSRLRHALWDRYELHRRGRCWRRAAPPLSRRPVAPRLCAVCVGHSIPALGTRKPNRCSRRSRSGDHRSHDSSLEGSGFELVWGLSCQVVFFRFIASSLFGGVSR